MVEKNEWYSLVHRLLVLIENSTKNSSRTDGLFIFLFHFRIHFNRFARWIGGARCQFNDSWWNDSLAVHAQLCSSDSLTRAAPQWICAWFRWIEGWTNSNRCISSRKAQRYAGRARLIFLSPFPFAAAVQRRFDYSSSDMDSLWSRVLRPSLGHKILDSKREEKRKSAPLPATNDEVNNQ